MHGGGTESGIHPGGSPSGPYEESTIATWFHFTLFIAEVSDEFLASSEDLNGDGHVDLANTNYAAENVSVLFGDGRGDFVLDEYYQVLNRPRHLCAADLDADGDPDLAVANWGAGNCSVLLNQGKGKFKLARSFGTGEMASCVASDDFNGDGLNDLVVTNVKSNTTTVLINDSGK